MTIHGAAPSLIPSVGVEIHQGWIGKLTNIVNALTVGRAAKQAYDAEVARGADPAKAVRRVFDRAA